MTCVLLENSDHFWGTFLDCFLSDKRLAGGLAIWCRLLHHPQSINAADWHQYARELIDAAYLAAFVFAVWLAVSGFPARLDHVGHLTGGAQ